MHHCLNLIQKWVHLIHNLHHIKLVGQLCEQIVHFLLKAPSLKDV